MPKRERSSASPVAFLGLAIAVAAVTAHAGIPEPDAVFYGSLRIDGVIQPAASGHQVELQRGTQTLASYTMGSLPEAGDFYVLRVTLEADEGGEPASDSGGVGDEGTLLVNGIPAARVYLGGRGLIARLDVAASSTAPSDFDGDGVADFQDVCAVSPSQADSDGNGIGDACEGIVNPGLLFEPVGDVDNPADPDTGKGAVAYDYAIGRGEVTNADYIEFLNAVAATDTYALYNEEMASDPRGGIVRQGSSGGYSYKVKPNMADKPVNFVSWLDAARYSNWLQNARPTGAQAPGTTETGAFDLTVADPATNAQAAAGGWSLPTENEWYKAAYYDVTQGDDYYWDYPTSSNIEPALASANAIGDVSNPGANVANYASGASWNGQAGHVTSAASAGATSPYGSFDQGGNLAEWLADDAEQGMRVLRGGAWQDPVFALARTADEPERSAVLRDPLYEGPEVGFRVTQVPEPDALALALGAVATVLLARRRRIGR